MLNVKNESWENLQEWKSSNIYFLSLFGVVCVCVCGYVWLYVVCFGSFLLFVLYFSTYHNLESVPRAHDDVIFLLQEEGESNGQNFETGGISCIY